MAIKIFNSTEISYTGTSADDIIIGNSLSNFIDAGEGNNIVISGAGNDMILSGNGNDIIFGGDGDDFIDAGGGNNIVFGGAGNDYISVTGGNNILDGGDGDDVITAGDGDDILHGGAGVDVIDGGGSTAGDENVVGNLFLVTSDDILLGGSGNDTFRITHEFEGVTVISGGVSNKDNNGDDARYISATENETTEEIEVLDTVTGEVIEIEDLEIAEQTETDVRLNIVTRPGSDAISTYGTTVAGYNAVDTIEFHASGDFSESLVFSGIERIELASGVNITLSSEQIENNGESLDREFLNPGIQFFGVEGGPAETVTIRVEYEEEEFEPSYAGASEIEYTAGALEFDDYSIADIFHNVDVIFDAQSESDEDSYVRIDGSNNSETVYGSEGVDNATLRLGDDVYYGNGGNDLIVGHGGADYLDGGEGDDIFLITGFGSGVQGTTSKADDGNPEWIATGEKHDVIVGGEGTDTLRITTGIGANTKTAGTIVLNDDNFKEMEVVQVGGTVGRLNTENAALQLINENYHFKANGTVADLSNALGNNGGTINNVVVDASGVTANGLTFEGNGNTQTFIGTTQDDRFIGNGGNDTLTGGAGSDTFVFGKVWEQIVTGNAATEAQWYTNTAFDLTGVDTITDFETGVDKIELNTDQFASLVGFNAGNLVVGSGPLDADDYLVFNTSTNTLQYYADGNGGSTAVDIAILTGVTSITAADIVVV